MKILIIGNSSHKTIQDYVKALRRNMPIQTLDIFNLNPVETTEPTEFYDKIFNAYHVGFFDNIKYLGYFRRHYFIFKEIRKNFLKINDTYDIIHIHFISVLVKKIIDLLPMKGKNIIASIWGSDLLRCKVKDMPTMRAIYDVADIITISNNEKVIQVFEENYNQYNKNKFYFPKYGSTVFSEIQSIMLNLNKKDAKRHLGLNSEKIAITIGYNATVEQRQVEIINVLLNNKEIIKYKGKIQFVFPMTYGSNKNNIIDIKLIMNKSHFEYKIFEKFLNDFEVANLRYASDIFIHLATTDVFCSSLREYMVAKNLVITGDWFPYTSLIEDGFYFDTIKNISEIGDRLLFWLSNFEEVPNYIKSNDERLIKTGDWDVHIKEWINIYKKTLNNI
jgi:glycosyltransferase involved in cell wall biosynthesis